MGQFSPSLFKSKLSYKSNYLAVGQDTSAFSCIYFAQSKCVGGCESNTHIIILQYLVHVLSPAGTNQFKHIFYNLYLLHQESDRLLISFPFLY